MKLIIPSPVSTRAILRVNLVIDILLSSFIKILLSHHDLGGEAWAWGWRLGLLGLAFCLVSSCIINSKTSLLSRYEGA